MTDLARKIIKYWRLFFIFRNMRLMTRMAYNINFFILAGSVLLQMFFSVVFVRVLFGFIGDLAGWGYYQALIVVATYMLLEGLMCVLCAYLSALGEHIRAGTLDGLLTKPIDAQILVSLWKGDPEDIVRIISGAAVLFYAVGNINLTFGQLAVNGLLYLIMLTNAFLITYSISLILRSISFWIIKGSSLGSLNFALTKMSQYPTDIVYHSFVKIALMTVIPLTFMATAPAKIFAYGFNWQLIAGSFLVTAAFLWASRKFWLFALSHYSSASG